MATGACRAEKLGGSWQVRYRHSGAIEPGNEIASLHRLDGLRWRKVDDYIDFTKYYGDDCVVWSGRDGFYAACGNRHPILVAKGGQDLMPEGIVSQGETFVRDAIPWRKLEIVPIDGIKRRAMAAASYRASWRTMGNSDEVPVITTARRLGLDERDDTGRTPLMWLVTQKDAEEVQALIRLGADVNAVDKNGNTALMFAADQGLGDIVRLLLKAGADPNREPSPDQTPLIRAVLGEHVQTALLLIEAGANVNVEVHKGDSVLSVAKRKGLDQVVSALRKAGAHE